MLPKVTHSVERKGRTRTEIQGCLTLSSMAFTAQPLQLLLHVFCVCEHGFMSLNRPLALY